MSQPDSFEDEWPIPKRRPKERGTRALYATPRSPVVPREQLQRQPSQGPFNTKDTSDLFWRLYPEEIKKDVQEQTSFLHRSSPLFNMYVKMTEEEDNEMTDRWQKDGDGILIFTGLFAAALAALLTVSVQDLKPNPQDTSIFYLANIYQLLADPNVSRPSILPTPAFSPPKSAVCVNSLWFLSLVIALTCALLATMLQQWGRRFVRITHPPRYSRYNAAPIRAFFENGLKKFHLRGSVEVLTALLHLSLFLFFSGLIVFLFNIDHTVFSCVASWVGLAGSVYGCITVMPIFWHDSPYYSPLSSSAWLFYNGMLYSFLKLRILLSRLFSSFCRFLQALPDLSNPRLSASERARLRASQSSHNPNTTYLRRISRGLTNTVQETGSTLSAEIKARIMIRTINALDKDKEFEQFFDAVPRFWDVFHDSVTNPVALSVELDLTIAEAFGVFLSRTLSLPSVKMEDRRKRVVICVMAADMLRLPHSTMNVLWSVFSLGGIDLFDVDLVQPLRNSGDRHAGLCSQGIIAAVIASSSASAWGWGRSDRRMELAKDQLGVSEEVFQSYLEKGDSVLLANFIHIARQLFRQCLKDIPNAASHLTHVLKSISKFDIENTLPDLQHDFCALWNEIVQEAHDRGSFQIPFYILRRIRHLYIALHKNTNAAPTAFDASTDHYSSVLYDPSSYPQCNIQDHYTSHPLTITSDPPDALLNLSKEPAVSFPASTGDDDRSRASRPHDVPYVPMPMLPPTEPVPPLPASTEDDDRSRESSVPAHMPMPTPDGVGVIPPVIPPTGMMAGMAMPSPSTGAGVVPQQIKFNGYGQYAGLLCHSADTVMFEDELYPTALHLLEAHKFLGGHPDLAERIRQCENVEDVMTLSAEMENFVRPDWANIALAKMDEVLYHKFLQHSDLRTLLLGTLPSELVYVESGDPFWGDGAGSGRNELGHSLMRVRERLRAESPR